MPNKWLAELGLLSLKQLWCDLAPLRGTARHELCRLMLQLSSGVLMAFSVAELTFNGECHVEAG